jgi:hypothetical protein
VSIRTIRRGVHGFPQSAQANAFLLHVATGGRKAGLFTLFAKPTPEQRKNILEHLKIAERCMSQCQKSIGALNLNRKRRQKPKPLTPLQTPPQPKRERLSQLLASS